MKPLELCRNKSFWLMDSLSGSLVKDALDILRKCEDGIWSEEQVAAYHEMQLAKLLRHCVDSVPAYRGKKGCERLADFAVTTKDTYRNDYDQYLSSKYDKQSLAKMMTSGSTGTPFTSYQNKEKRKRVYAEVLYYNGKVNYQIGKRIIYFRSVVGEVAKSPLQQFAQNIYLVDCTDLSDAGIERGVKLIAKLTRHTDAMIMGYASTLDAFSRYFEKYGYEKAGQCNVSGVVSGSEMLYDTTRTALEKAFGCKCVSRYANEENGFIGQDYEMNNAFIPNRANYYIEILKMDSDEPTANGEVGRIVVTDLYNYAMPMVRYDTGDVGAWQLVDDNGKKRRAIGAFGGRKIDMVFNTKGDIVSSYCFTNLMWRYQNVKQFQFAQIGPASYEMRLVKIGNIDEMELLERLHHYVGEDAVIKIVYLDNIAALKSGKKRYVTNEMKK